MPQINEYYIYHIDEYIVSLKQEIKKCFNDHHNDIRLNKIKEAMKDKYSTVKGSFELSHHDRIEVYIDMHYYDPFKNMNLLLNYASDLSDEFKNLIIEELEDYSLTEFEIQILIMLHKKTFFPSYAIFCQKIIKVNFRVVDENFKLTTDCNYLNGELRCSDDGICEDYQDQYLKSPEQCCSNDGIDDGID